MRYLLALLLLAGSAFCQTGTSTQTQTAGGSGGGGSGTVTSVSGTTNQIGVATGTTTPVISITNPFIFPGEATGVASTTGAATFNIPPGTAPSAPVSGDLFNVGGILEFFDGTNTNREVTTQAAVTSGHCPQFSGTNGLLVDSGSTNCGGGSGTVTSVSVTTANGVSGTVATATTTPAISLALGAITPSSVAISDTAANNDLTVSNTTPTVTGASTTVALSTGVAPSNAGGNSWVYTLAATTTGAGSNGWVGAAVTLAGYTGGATGNNGTSLPITASTTTTVTITNATGTVTNTGTPTMISSAVVASPIQRSIATYNAGTAGSLVSTNDIWSWSDVPSSVAPNPVTKLVFAHTGSTEGAAGIAMVQFPQMLQFNVSPGSIDVNNNGGTLNFSQAGGTANAGSVSWASGPGNFGLTAKTAGKTLFNEANYTTQAGSLFSFANISNLTATSGAVIGVNIGGAVGGTAGTESLTWAPASGSGTFTAAEIAPIIGGTSSGATTAFDVNPVPTLANLSGTNLIGSFRNNGTNEFTVDYSGNTVATGTQTSGVAGGAPNVDKTIGMLTTDMGTIASATLTPITNMTWTLVASKNYVLDCEIFLTAATSGTAAFGLVGPGTPTSYSLEVDGNIGAAGSFFSAQINAGAAWVSTATPASGAFAGTSRAHLRAGIQNGSTAGTLTLDYSNPAAAGTLKANANSWCRLTQVN